MTDTSAKTTPLLQTHKISKQFGGNKVFNEISISLDKGKVLGVIGPNGAGKTTLINVISGQLQPTSGEILLEGRNVTPASFHARSAMGLVRTFQQTKAFKTATVLENLQRAQLFSKKGMALDAPYVTALLDFAGLASRMDQVADTLPYGMQKMLGLMMAFVTEPRILLLDEPAAGLEKDERFFIDRYVEAAMRELGCGVLLVEHDMELVKRLCPRICVLDGGKLIAEGTPAEVLSRRDVIEAYLGSAADEEVSHA
ncbi:ABC transporter ATP-binding protein [Daeguia caeni]|uniref:ABC transporter ATP-binding protein n=1 Tax=Daeguia caeni TaxID=439612 RepID=A0ABV9H2I0_9HYPH